MRGAYLSVLLTFAAWSTVQAQDTPVAVPEAESSAALAQGAQADFETAEIADETATEETVEIATEESVETPETEAGESRSAIAEIDSSLSAPNTNEVPAATNGAVEEPEAIESTDAREIEGETPDAHTLDRSRHHWRPWASGLFHISLLSDRLTVSTLNIRFGYGVNAGARRGAWGVYGHLEQNLYAETEFDFTARAGTLNIAVGGERFLFRERLRMAAAIGVSVLLSDLALDSAGSVGLFLQLKPAGIRFARRSQVVVQLDLLSVTITAPVLASPSVVDLQYRTTLAIEWQGRS